MRILKLALVLLLCCLLPAAGSAGGLNNLLPGAIPNPSSYVPGELLVTFAPTRAFATSRSALASSHGAVAVAAVDSRGLTKVQLRSGQTVASALSEYAADPYVLKVQPNFKYQLAATTPNDPQITDQWGVKNTGQTIAAGTYSPTVGTSGKDMDLTIAWDTLTDCSSVIVAVIDTGMNYNHQDLSGSLWSEDAAYPNHGYDFQALDNDPMDGHGHGTHVSATIGATGNNALGVAGVCWKAKIMALKVFDPTGAGGTSANIAAAMNFAVSKGAKVINLSLTSTPGGGVDAVQDAAIATALASGVIIVAAAGNDGTDNDVTPKYPCNSASANMICVAALDQNYDLATFSNYGLTSVDVGGPGTNISASWNGTSTSISAGITTWTKAASWGNVTCTYGGLIYNFLANPGTYCDGSSNYTDDLIATGLTAATYKNFTTFSGYDALTYSFYSYVDLGSDDSLRISYVKANASPFAGGGTTLDFFTGHTSELTYFPYDITSCQGANCTLGFEVRTGATQNADEFGVGLVAMGISGLVLNNTTYKNISGTSMATPHVAGLVAMIWAHNPSYTMADVIDSLKSGAEAVSDLNGVTTTGKGVNASGSLNHIIVPTGVTLTVQ